MNLSQRYPRVPHDCPNEATAAVYTCLINYDGLPGVIKGIQDAPSTEISRQELQGIAHSPFQKLRQDFPRGTPAALFHDLVDVGLRQVDWQWLCARLSDTVGT